MRVISEAEACSHSDELLSGESAQTVAQLLGAVTRKPLSWLAACVLAFIAERRAARKARIISTQPSALLGTPAVSPANTARAALSASEESDFLRLRRELRCRRFGRSTSSTLIPCAFKWRVSPTP